MSKHNDGGPAFPRPVSEDITSGTQLDGNCTVPEQNGMSLRQWYAGMAMMGIYANPKTFEERLKPAEVAEGAFNAADAMIARGS